VLIVFAVNFRETFQSLQDWVQALEDNTDSMPALIIVGNKTDMRDDPTASGDLVGFDEAVAYAEGLHAVYVETSCKTGQGIDSLLDEMAKAAFARADKEATSETMNGVVDLDAQSGGPPPCTC
jgi:GTPase SAR1 family protein